MAHFSATQPVVTLFFLLWHAAFCEGIYAGLLSGGFHSLNQLCLKESYDHEI